MSTNQAPESVVGRPGFVAHHALWTDEQSQKAKEIVRKAVDWSEEEGWAKQGEISGPVFTSEDAREGATAFAEKREPVWQGR